MGVVGGMKSHPAQTLSPGRGKGAAAQKVGGDHPVGLQAAHGGKDIPVGPPEGLYQFFHAYPALPENGQRHRYEAEYFRTRA